MLSTISAKSTKVLDFSGDNLKFSLRFEEAMPLIKKLNLLLFLIVPVTCVHGADPIISNAWTGFKTGKGPVWLTVDMADADKDELKLVKAEVAYKQRLGLSDYSDILTPFLASLRFAGDFPARPYSFIWQMPAEFLEIDTINLHFRLQVSDNVNNLSEVFEFSEANIDIKTQRERSWRRIDHFGQEKAAVTFNPGNYLKYATTCAGFSAAFGYAANMGFVEIKEGGVVLEDSPYDLYPPTIPADVFPAVANFTQYSKTRVLELEDVNRLMTFEMKLLEEKNPKSLFTGMAFAGFSFERYLQNKTTLIERDILMDTPDIKLFSVPEPFAADHFLKFFELGLGISQVVAKAQNHSRAKALPPGVTGIKIKTGPFGGELKEQILTSMSGIDTRNWEEDQPRRFVLSWVGPLGLSSVPTIDTILFKLSQPESIDLSEDQHFISVNGASLGIEAQAREGFVQMAVLNNEGRFPQFAENAKIVVLQPEDSFVESEWTISGEDLGMGSWYMLDVSEQDWKALSVINGEAKFKSKILVRDGSGSESEKLGSESSAEDSASAAGGGGGGCLIRWRSIRPGL